MLKQKRREVISRVYKISLVGFYRCVGRLMGFDWPLGGRGEEGAMIFVGFGVVGFGLGLAFARSDGLDIEILELVTKAVDEDVAWTAPSLHIWFRLSLVISNSIRGRFGFAG